MSEKLIIPQVLTSPMLWGVKVEWKWPDGSHWFSKLEMQYLYSDGRLEKQVIGWPVTGKAIGGLKAGERLQIRLRPIDKNGAVREWTQGDWIEGVASSDAGEYLDAMTVGSDMRLMATFSAPHFTIAAGQMFITDAFIKNSIQTAKLSSPPTISSFAKPREKVRSIVAPYMSGAASEFTEELVDELMNLAYPSCSESSAYTYSASMHINCTDAQPATGVDSNIEAILKNALANIAEEAANQAAAADKAIAELSECVRKAIHKECLPGGLLWNRRGR